MAQNYVVDYRIGGELMCKWRRVLGTFPLAEAQAKRDELNRMGYAAIVQSARSAAALGLPVGWRAASVDGKPAWIISTNYRYADEKLTVMQIEYSKFDATGYYYPDGEPAFGSAKIRNRKTKREGWINVYRTLNKVGLIYSTEQEAKEVATDTVVATIKIEWEE